jgi:hypothetical protein
VKAAEPHGEIIGIEQPVVVGISHKESVRAVRGIKHVRRAIVGTAEGTSNEGHRGELAPPQEGSICRGACERQRIAARRASPFKVENDVLTSEG